MKPKSFSVTWIGPEFDGDFFGSVICAQVGMILNILGLIVEPWLSWLFWAVLVMSQRAKPKVFFCETAMVGPHTAETFLEVMWWWASGRTLMQIQPGWSSELRVGNEPPKLQSCCGCIHGKLWIQVFQYVSTQIFGFTSLFLVQVPTFNNFIYWNYTERFVLSNSRAELLGNLVPLNPQAETQEGGYARDSLWRIGGVRQGLYGDQRGIDYELWKIMIRVTF